MLQPTGKQFVSVLNIYRWQDQAILLLGVYPREKKMCLHTETHMWTIHSNHMRNGPKLEATQLSHQQEINE